MNYYVEVLKKYAVFSGRARRAEYWTFVLCNIIIGITIAFIEKAIVSNQEFGEGVLSIIYSIAILIPSLAVLIRRLHDTNHNFAWLFIYLVPLIGPIVLFIFLIRDSDPGENQYGPNPKKIDLEKSDKN